MSRKKFEQFDLIEHIRHYFQIRPYKDIISWCEQNIDFSQQISAERNKLDFEQYPYQVPILKQWQNEKKVIKTITVVAPEQTGKTNIFVDGLLYNMEMNPCQSLIVYPNDQLAVATNQTKLLPLMKHIPVLKRELQNPRSFRRDSYKFSNLISYFQGAGAKIVSRSCKIVVGDEVDAWPTINGIDNVADLKKRTRSYNSSICFLISTPTEQNGRIWKSFLNGSRGYWYLRCKGCGQLTMRSCDIHNLQFESDYDEETKVRTVRKDTIRLICPKCKHQHVEADKKWMNVNGGFIHSIPQRLEEAPSFQIGALASQLPSLNWSRIANAQLEASKRNDIETHITFDNSYRGLPYKRRQVVAEDLERIRQHEWKPSEAPKQDQIEMIFVTADTQDDRSVVGVWAFDVNDNLYLLKASEPTYLMLSQAERQKINQVIKQEAQMKKQKYVPVETVQDIFEAEYLVENGVGIKPSFIVIDRRGHRANDVDYFFRNHPKSIAWLGSKLQMVHYKPSKDIHKGVLANANHYQCQQIWYLYSQKKRNSQYLFLYPDIELRIIDQIAAYKPNPNTINGHHPQNWTCQNRVHDWFDVTKMAYFAMQYAIQESMYKTNFRFCKSPRLLRRFEPLEQKEQQKIHRETQKKKYFTQTFSINSQYINK